MRLDRKRETDLGESGELLANAWSMKYMADEIRTTMKPLADITREDAITRIETFTTEGRLVQNSWHTTADDGRELACLLGAIHPDINAAAACPASVMPAWMAELLVTLFDGVTPENATAYGLRFAAALKTGKTNDGVRRSFLVTCVSSALDAARPNGKPPAYWAAIQASCENVIVLLQNPSATGGDYRAAADAVWAAADAAAVWAAADAAADAAVRAAAVWAAVWAAADAAAVWAAADAAADAAARAAVRAADAAARAAARAADAAARAAARAAVRAADAAARAAVRAADAAARTAADATVQYEKLFDALIVAMEAA